MSPSHNILNGGYYLVTSFPCIEEVLVSTYLSLLSKICCACSWCIKSMVDKIINLGHTEWSIHWQTFVWIGVVRPLQGIGISSQGGAKSMLELVSIYFPRQYLVFIKHPVFPRP